MKNYRDIRNNKIYTVKEIGVKFVKICHEDDPNTAKPEDLSEKELIEIGREIAKAHREYVPVEKGEF